MLSPEKLQPVLTLAFAADMWSLLKKKNIFNLKRLIKQCLLQKTLCRLTDELHVLPAS